MTDVKAMQAISPLLTLMSNWDHKAWLYGLRAQLYGSKNSHAALIPCSSTGDQNGQNTAGGEHCLGV